MNRSKAKGTAWERRIVEHLRANGWPDAERRVLHGNTDLGDVVNGPAPLTIEAKNAKTVCLAEWVDEAIAEAANVGNGSIGVVMFPRRNHAIGKGYAVLRIDDLLDLVKRGFGVPVSSEG
jgi:hypothetical protein